MLNDYLALTKPRIATLVMMTAAFGYSMAGGSFGAGLLWTVLGTGLCSAACGSLNQALEGGPDALMERTRRRAVAAGRLRARDAFLFGLVLAAAGLAALAYETTALAAALTAATVLAYAFLYTPMKRFTPQATWVGAAAGAAPPLIGWAAARGSLCAQAWVLFGIQFLWQIPHFLSLFWIHRRDYERAGFRVMPVVDPEGGLTATQIALHSFTVLPMALAPVFLGMAGKTYGFTALALSLGYLLLGLKASWSLRPADTRRLFLASLAYLPLLFMSLLLGGA
ncbi:MAG: heme o synthase [Elusimicrobia bacterium]|nr:heme o synthase [Elusimicrobiota bacterium]MDE2424957.1 heme o synthase [Elusimicrobiota bacterium]